MKKLSSCILVTLSVTLTACGNWDYGIFQEPFTGGWQVCLVGRCTTLRELAAATMLMFLMLVISGLVFGKRK
jgi:hypothetical protein